MNKRQSVNFHLNGDIETMDKDGEMRIWVRKRTCYYCHYYRIGDKVCIRPNIDRAPGMMFMARDGYCSNFIPRL